MTDPVFQDDNQNPLKVEETHDDIFWWSDDVFENENIFEPVKKEENTSEESESQQNEAIIPEKTEIQEETPTFEEIPSVEENTVEENNDLFGGEEENQKNQQSSWTDVKDPINETLDSSNEPQNDNTFEGIPSVEENTIEENTIEEPTETLQDIPVAAVATKEAEETEEIEEKVEEKIKNSEEDTSNEDTIETESEKDEKTPLQRNFYKMLFLVKDIYKLKNIEDSESFDISGFDANKDSYNFNLGFNIIDITKKDKEDENENKLTFKMNKNPNNLEILVNDELLYNEEQDIKNNPENENKIKEKFDKLLILLEEEKNKQKENSAKEKKKKLRGVFRDF